MWPHYQHASEHYPHYPHTTFSSCTELPHFPTPLPLQMTGSRSALNFLITQHHTMARIAFPETTPDVVGKLSAKDAVRSAYSMISRLPN